MDTAALAKALAVEGPFATLYVDAKQPTEDAIRELDLRVRALRGQLKNQGADAATLEALDRALTELDPGHPRAFVAAGGQVLHEQHLSGPVPDLAWWRPLPYLLPLFRSAQAQVPYVLVLADRTGADVLAHAGETVTATEQVTGSHDEIRRSAPGGWSQARYQHRAEDSWEGNAREVADHVGRLAQDVGARLVLLDGDVRAVQLLREHLPPRWQDHVEVLDEGGGRAIDGSEAVIADAVRERARVAAARELAAVVERFEQERGQHDRAASGARATIEAFQQSRVETLLVNDDPADERTAWFGREPDDLAWEPAGSASPEPHEARLADVLVRAALGTGADVRVVPPEVMRLEDGVGALLRWS